MKIVFVCTMGRLRSKTAAHLLRSYGYDVDYCGTAKDADKPLDIALLHSADKIICFEQCHRNSIRRKTQGLSKKIVVWNIPNEFYYMQPELQDWISAKFNEMGIVK